MATRPPRDHSLFGAAGQLVLRDVVEIASDRIPQADDEKAAELRHSCASSAAGAAHHGNRAGLGRERIGQDIASGMAEMESYGQMVLANPDFVERIRAGAPLNEPRKELFYGGGASGYIDYPTLSGSGAVPA